MKVKTKWGDARDPIFNFCFKCGKPVTTTSIWRCVCRKCQSRAKKNAGRHSLHHCVGCGKSKKFRWTFTHEVMVCRDCLKELRRHIRDGCRGCGKSRNRTYVDMNSSQPYPLCGFCNPDRALRAVAKRLRLKKQGYETPPTERTRTYRKSSKGEIDVAKNLMRLTKVERNIRQLISPYEIDIYLPELKIGIEYNGNYWHSNKVVSSGGKFESAGMYHSYKVVKALEVGISLYFVWESDWIYERETVKSALKILVESKGIDVHPILNKVTDTQEAGVL